MKITNYLAMMLMALCIISCSDDDNTPAAMIIAGTYNGTIDMSVQGASQGSFDEIKVTIQAQEDGKVEVTLPAFGSGAMGFKGDMVMKDIELTVDEDDTYTLAGTVNTISDTTEVTGSLSGTIKDKKANITFSLKPGLMPFPITVTFTSK